MPFIDVNGKLVHYRDDDFRDPWDTERAVFMQHYVYGSSQDFRSWVPALGRRARVLRMDRPGNGLSPAPSLAWTISVDNILELFVSFLDELGVEKVHYVGESLGGCLGVLFAVRHPERVHTLTLCSTPLSISTEFQKAFFIPEGYEDAPSAVRELGAWQYYHTALGGIYPTDDPVNRMRDAARTEMRANIPTQVVARLLDMVTDPAFDIRGILGQVSVPTLVLTGPNSRSAPPEDQKFLVENIPGAEQLIYDCAEPAWELPDESAAATREFILRHS